MNTSNNIIDPRETGVSGIEGLKGIPQSSNIFEEYLTSQGVEPSVQNMIALNRELARNTPIIGSYKVSDFPEFGLSKQDSKITNALELNSLNEFRAQEQSGIDKLLNGLTKAVGLAGTTFTDGVLGSLFGVGEAIAYMAMDEETKEKYKQETGNDNAFEAFWHNSLSRELAHINDNLEKILPNYYTQYEIDNPFRLNANTIGDKFLKNVGFLAGAMYSGRLGGKAVGKLLQIDKTRKAFKGATILGKNADDLTNKQIVDMIKSGVDNGNIVDDVLIKNAKKLKNKDLATKIFGSVTAAGGEARIEANMNIDQYYNLDLNNLKKAYEEASSSVESQLFKEHPEWFGLKMTGDGRLINTIISSEGLAEYQKRQDALKAKYEEGLKVLQDEATSMGNRIFLADFALLSLTNLGTFGRFLGGGYSAGRLAQSGSIKGSLRGTIEANKKGFINNAARVMKAPITEGVVEEMMQESINKAAGYKASSHLNEFWGSKVNPEAEDKAISFMDAMARGMAETYGSAEGWEVGTIAALSSIIGLPRFKNIVTTDQTTGKKKLNNVTEWFNGEFWEEIKDIKKEKELAKKYITAANENSDNRIQTLWDHAVRGITLTDKAEEAAKNGDKFEYLNAESASIANDVILYSRLGMYQELVDFAEQAENITEDDVELIKELTSNKEGKGFYSDKSNEEIVKDIKERASKYKETIERMHDTSESLKVLYGEDISDEALLALTYGFSVIDNTTNRIKELLKDESVIKFIKETEKKINATNRTIRAENKKLTEEKDKKSLVEQLSPYETLESTGVDEFLNEENPETLSKWLDKVFKNPEVIKQVLNEEKVLNPTILQEEGFRKLLDLRQLVDFRDSVIDEYNAVANNPDLFTDEGIALQNEMINKYNQNKAKEVISNWKKEGKEISTYKDLLSILNDNTDYEEFILENIERSGSEQEKNIVKGYKEVRSRAKILADTINSVKSKLTEEEYGVFGEMLSVMAEAVVTNDETTDGMSFDIILDDVFSSAVQDDINISEEVKNRIKETLDEVKKSYKENLATYEELSKEVEAPKKPTLKEKVSQAVNTVANKVKEKVKGKEEDKEKSKGDNSVSSDSSTSDNISGSNNDTESEDVGTIEDKAEIVDAQNEKIEESQKSTTDISTVYFYSYDENSKKVVQKNRDERFNTLNTYGAQAFLDSKEFYGIVQNNGKKDLKFKLIKIGNNYYVGLNLTNLGLSSRYGILKDGKNNEYQLVSAVSIENSNHPIKGSYKTDSYTVYDDVINLEEITEGFFQRIDNNGQTLLTKEMIDEALGKVYLGIYKEQKVFYGSADSNSYINIGGEQSKNGHVFLVVPTINGYRARAVQTISIGDFWNSLSPEEKKAVMEGVDYTDNKKIMFFTDFKNAIINYYNHSDKNDNWQYYKDEASKYVILPDRLILSNEAELKGNALFESFINNNVFKNYQLAVTGITSPIDSANKLSDLVEMGAIKVNVGSLNNIGVALKFSYNKPSTSTKTNSNQNVINPTIEEVNDANNISINTEEFTVPSEDRGVGLNVKKLEFLGFSKGEINKLLSGSKRGTLFLHVLFESKQKKELFIGALERIKDSSEYKEKIEKILNSKLSGKDFYNALLELINCK